MKNKVVLYWITGATTVLVSTLTPMILMWVQILMPPRRSQILPLALIEIVIYVVASMIIIFPLIHIGKGTLKRSVALWIYLTSLLFGIIVFVIGWLLMLAFELWMILPMYALILSCIFVTFVGASREKSNKIGIIQTSA